MLKNKLSLPNFYHLGERTQVLDSILKGKSFDLSSGAGQFSELVEDESYYYLVRDGLGLNKLFYHLDESAKCLTVGNFILELAKETKDANKVFSVPAGHYLKVDKKSFKKELISYYDLSRVSLPAFDLEKFQATIANKLEIFFKSLNPRFPKAQFVVCLSGGLDSSLVAFYAQKHLSNVVAATFSFASLSEDYSSASGIAKVLGIPFVPIVEERKFDTETLHKILEDGQDWRDFNVHCAWVNHILARNLKKKYPNQEVVVLTGDLMNEFVTDYAPVNFKDTIYYALPRIPKSRLRQFLIYGLDSGDREVGIFNAEGLKLIQPYGLLAEDYLSVPAEILEKSNCKEILNQPLLKNPQVLEFIHKSKLRAQVGGKEGGTLGLFHDHQMSQEKVKKEWEQLFKPYCREGEVLPLIEAGRYRH